jgi:hypothetical protein
VRDVPSGTILALEARRRTLPMMSRLPIAFALLATLALVPAAAAKPNKPDCTAALPAVQAAVAADCDCAGAPTHGQYVRCAGKVVKGLVADGTLEKGCKGSMVRTAAKSSCGKGDALTCCVERRNGVRCLVKTAAACERLGGTPGATPFCADACVASPNGAFVD